MPRRLPRPALLLAVALLLALVAVATRAGSPGPAPVLTGPSWVGVASDTIVQSLLILVIVAAVLATGLSIWAVFPLPGGKPRARPLSASLMAYLYFAAAVAVLIILRQRLPRSAAAARLAGGQGLFRGPTGAPMQNHSITWLSVVIVVLVLGAAALLFVRWWRSAGGRRRRPGADAAVGPASRDLILAAIGESLDALRAEADPRRAVIGAYARLEGELRAIGRPRLPSEAPLEYLARILAAFTASAPSLHRLTDLFEWARFSDHPVDRAMKEDAIRALEDVRAEVEALGLRRAG